MNFIPINLEKFISIFDSLIIHYFIHYFLMAYGHLFTGRYINCCFFKPVFLFIFENTIMIAILRSITFKQFSHNYEIICNSFFNDNTFISKINTIAIFVIILKSLFILFIVIFKRQSEIALEVNIQKLCVLFT